MLGVVAVDIVTAPNSGFCELSSPSLLVVAVSGGSWSWDPGTLARWFSRLLPKYDHWDLYPVHSQCL